MTGSLENPPVIDKALPDEAATKALARSLARIAAKGDVFALSGDLGTGKTVFARAFILARSGADEEVPSPTFTLVQTYDLPGAMVYHFDLFRISDASETFELDIDDAFSEGISLIEWPERMAGLLPEARLDLDFAYGEVPDARRVRITGHQGWPERLGDSGLV